MGNFFKLNALKSKGLSLGIASIMIFKGAIFPWRKGLGCLGEQLHWGKKEFWGGTSHKDQVLEY